MAAFVVHRDHDHGEHRHREAERGRHLHRRLARLAGGGRDNTSKGASNGIFLRDAGTVSPSRATPCRATASGIARARRLAPGPVGDSTFIDNTFTKNDKFCPAQDEGPSNGGVGIAIANGSGVDRRRQHDHRQQAHEGVDLSGGVACRRTAWRPGDHADASDEQPVHGQHDHRERPRHLVPTAAGPGTRSPATGCTTSQPEGLCAG